MGEIIPSESLSHVTYIGINSMHSQKTKQSYIRSTRQNRTRKKKRRRKKEKKSAGEEWALRKSKINRITKERKALEQPPPPPPPRKKSTKYIKLLRTEPLKTGRPKNKPELKELATERIRALQTAQKTTTQEKSWMEDGSEKTAWKSRT